jgi:hypothetical protein
LKWEGVGGTEFHANRKTTNEKSVQDWFHSQYSCKNYSYSYKGYNYNNYNKLRKSLRDDAFRFGIVPQSLRGLRPRPAEWNECEMKTVVYWYSNQWRTNWSRTNRTPSEKLRWIFKIEHKRNPKFELEPKPKYFWTRY